MRLFAVRFCYSLECSKAAAPYTGEFYGARNFLGSGAAMVVAKHYPHGADECSIAARETLLEFAERFRQNS